MSFGQRPCPHCNRVMFLEPAFDDYGELCADCNADLKRHAVNEYHAEEARMGIL